PHDSYQLGIAVHKKGSDVPLIKWSDRYIQVNSDFHVEKISVGKPDPSTSIRYWIDNIQDEGDRVVIDGWAFPERRDGISKTNLILKLKNGVFRMNTDNVRRPDLPAFFKDHRLEYAGFFTSLPKDQVSPGSYRIGFEIVYQDGSTSLVFYDKHVK